MFLTALHPDDSRANRASPTEPITGHGGQTDVGLLGSPKSSVILADWFSTMINKATAKKIEEELALLRHHVEAANNSCGSIVNLIIEHQPTLVSDATIVAETGRLLE